ncbi:MAG TPA: hypothetical protein VFV49_13275 [Thermoanaerobaculia bacterium]|nr:hypothetical protein [Thermoanaerobaculia bacterium]
MLRTAVLRFLLLLASPSILAGEYGLIVDPSYPASCQRDPSSSLNYCAPAAVMQDLRDHFLAGKPFRLKAVEMAVLSGRISLTADALPAFNDVIAAVCTSESPHDFDTLEKFLHYLPYRSLRERLESELAVTSDAKPRARLRDALAALPPKKAQAALLAYKKELTGAGDRDQCDAAVKRVTRAMTADSRLSDADIQAEIDLYEKVKGPMPYPSPGTACALFGFQEAAHAALDERRKKSKR